MEIKRVAQSSVNEKIVMTVCLTDYKGQVAKRINEKMPLATIKGFRKGQVPKDIVEKFYGKAIKQEEVKKVVDLALERFIESEKIHLLGTPLLIDNENLNWSDEELNFEFEIGLAPNIEFNFGSTNSLVKYDIVVDDKIIDQNILQIQKQFGKTSEQEIIDETSIVSGLVKNESGDINVFSSIEISTIKNKALKKEILGKKTGDTISLKTKGLFEDDHQLISFLKISHDRVHGLDITVDLTIENIEKIELATLDQDLFGKLFGANKPNSVEELRAKIRKNNEFLFAKQSSEKLKVDIQKFLVETTKFDLPDAFLKKWLQTTGDKKLTQEEAEREYNQSEKGLRFQLIESKALSENDVKITFEDLKSFTTMSIIDQMAQFGQSDVPDEEVQKIVAQVLSKQEDVKRLSTQVLYNKGFDFFIEKLNPQTKKVSHDEFMAAVYGE